MEIVVLLLILAVGGMAAMMIVLVVLMSTGRMYKSEPRGFPAVTLSPSDSKGPAEKEK